MSTNDTVIRVLADLELAGLPQAVKQIQKLTKDASIEFDANDFLSKWKGVQKKAGSAFGETIRDALKMGVSSKNLRGLTNAYADLSKKIEEAQKDGATAASKIHLQGLEKRFKQENHQVGKINKRRMAALKEAGRWQGKNQAEIAEGFAKSLKSAFGSLKGGDLAGVLGGIGKGAQAAGGAALKGGQKGGGMGEALAGIGKLMSALGPVILAVGALMGAIGVLVSAVIMADGKFKELNRTLMESGVAGADLVGRYGDAHKIMEKVQRTFTNGQGAFAFNRIWGTTAKDHLQILGAYAQAGQTLKEMTAGARNAQMEMKQLRDHTQAALAYSKLLGVSAQELAGNMASWMEDLGENINGVQQGLSAVTMAARDSGFGVKRFFSMVLQATSGMSMYNVRLEEAGSLLIRLGKILGAKVGGDFLQQLTKGFSGEGMQERYKRTMHTKGMKGIFRRSATNIGDDFLRKLGGVKDPGKRAQILSAMGLSEKQVQGMGGKGLAGHLGGMGAGQRESMLANARLSGEDDLVRSLANLTDVSQGAAGGKGMQAMRMGSLDMGGKFAAQLAAAQTIFGKELHMLSLKETMAYESVTGVTGERREERARLSEAMSGDFNMLQRLASKGVSDKEQRNLAEQLGVTIKDGQIVSARITEDGYLDFGKEIKDFGDYLQTQGDTFRKAAKDGVPADIQLATQIATNTTDMNKILEQGVEYWLVQINSAVQDIRGMLGGLSGDEKIAKGQAVGQYAKEIRSLQRQERRKTREVSALGAEVSSSTGMDREKAQRRLAKAESELFGIQKLKAHKTLILEEMRRDNTSGWTDRTSADFERANAARVSSKALGSRLVGEGAISSEAESQIRSRAYREHDKKKSTLDWASPEIQETIMRPFRVEAEKKYHEALEAYQKKDLGDQEKLHGTGGKAPKASAAEIQKVLERMSTLDLGRKFKSVLGGADVDVSMEEAKGLASEYRQTGVMPEAIRSKYGLRSGKSSVIERLGGAMPVLGYTASTAATGQRVTAPEQTGAWPRTTKPDKAASGKVEVHMHNYNDTRGWMNNLERFRQVFAGLGG
jgi:hypothetical protein